MDGDYLVHWTVDYASKEISFNLTVKTTGWVGFGIGVGFNTMLGGDVVTGWVDDVTRQVYVSHTFIWPLVPSLVFIARCKIDH